MLLIVDLLQLLKYRFDVWRLETVTKIYNDSYLNNLLKVIGDECCDLSDATNGEAICENIGDIDVELIQCMKIQPFPHLCCNEINVRMKGNYKYFEMAVEYLYALDDMSNINEFKKFMMEQYLNIQ